MDEIKNEDVLNAPEPEKAPEPTPEISAAAPSAEMLSIIEGVCFHCRTKQIQGATIEKSKGSRNQFKFCGLECFNADQTPNDA